MNPGDAEARILALLAEALTANIGDPSWISVLLRRRPGLRRAVSAVLIALARDHDTQFDAAFTRQATSAARKAAQAARRMNTVAPTPSHALAPTVIAPPRRVANQVRQVMPMVLRMTDDIYRRVVAQVTLAPITTEKDRLSAVQAALDHFAREGITAFVDRSGRKWSLTSYLEMATRTALRTAAEDWYVHELTKVGIDLAWVTSVSNSCPKCAPFVGNLVSLNGVLLGPVGVGEDGRLLEAVDLRDARTRGYGHMNCRCFLVPYAPGDKYVSPQGDPARYKDEQQLRRLERAVRYAKSQSATAVTPERQASAARKVRAAQAALRNHLATTAVPRQRHREQLDSPR
ncbi:phage minor capsid protein [Gordonia bronchialis]|uniref:phage minor capsid protein n=1 Tax=Gordonia bronchialis TaxID=2054 RepID=UPI001CBF27C6|nr:phage minor capsid protein [Gordonia bronchialis]UAK38438.1 phage minor capsid protein [Gordonia bronchialis]